MKQIIILIFFTTTINIVFGQNNLEKQKSIFIEIAGSGGLGSINYEKQFYKKDLLDLTCRVGFSFAPIDRNNGVAIIFPVMVNSLLGKDKHKLELGLGQGFTITTKGSPFALTTAAIGYRYTPADSSWFYRVTYTPLISYLVDFQVQQWAGLSIGYKLK